MARQSKKKSDAADTPVPIAAVATTELAPDSAKSSSVKRKRRRSTSSSAPTSPVTTAATTSTKSEKAAANKVKSKESKSQPSDAAAVLTPTLAPDTAAAAADKTKTKKSKSKPQSESKLQSPSAVTETPAAVSSATSTAAAELAVPTNSDKPKAKRKAKASKPPAASTKTDKSDTNSNTERAQPKKSGTTKPAKEIKPAKQPANSNSNMTELNALTRQFLLTVVKVLANDKDPSFLSSLHHSINDVSNRRKLLAVFGNDSKTVGKLIDGVSYSHSEGLYRPNAGSKSIFDSTNVDSNSPYYYQHATFTVTNAACQPLTVTVSFLTSSEIREEEEEELIVKLNNDTIYNYHRFQLSDARPKKSYSFKTLQSQLKSSAIPSRIIFQLMLSLCEFNGDFYNKLSKNELDAIQKQLSFMRDMYQHLHEGGERPVDYDDNDSENDDDSAMDDSEDDNDNGSDLEGFIVGDDEDLVIDSDYSGNDDSDAHEAKSTKSKKQNGNSKKKPSKRRVIADSESDEDIQQSIHKAVNAVKKPQIVKALLSKAKQASSAKKAGKKEMKKPITSSAASITAPSVSDDTVSTVGEHKVMDDSKVVNQIVTPLSPIKVPAARPSTTASALSLLSDDMALEPVTSANGAAIIANGHGEKSSEKPKKRKRTREARKAEAETEAAAAAQEKKSILEEKPAKKARKQNADTVKPTVKLPTQSPVLSSPSQQSPKAAHRKAEKKAAKDKKKQSTE